MKSINKNYIEDLVINKLENNFFNKNAIETMVSKIHEYTINQSCEFKEEIKQFEMEIKKVEKEIENIINAISAGMFHESMKEKLSNLENKKSSLALRIEEYNLKLKLYVPEPKMIKSYLKSNSNIKIKNLDEQQKTIRTFIEKVVVFEDQINVYTIFDIIGGDGGSRTHVRKHFTKSFSECSCYI